MDQKIKNMITMIGCNEKQFISIIKKAVGNISLSSGSWHTPYYILDNNGILAKYSSKGILEYSR